MKKQKALAILLVVIMLLAMMPTSVFADSYVSGVLTIDSDFETGFLEEKVEESESDPSAITTLNIVSPSSELNSVDLAYINNNMTSLEVLNIANTITVGAVGDDFFNSNSTIVSVTMPATSFGSGAFVNCSSLTTVILPNATTFGNDAFRLDSLLTNVSLPSATTFGSGAFRDSTSITTLDATNLPAVETLGPQGFMGCTGLTTINSTTLTSISSDGFAGCTSLNSVTLPNLTNMTGANAFDDCDALTSISLPSAEQCAWFMSNSDNITTVELLSMDSFGDGIFYAVPTKITMTLGADIPSYVSGSAFTDYDPISKSAVVYVPYGSGVAYDLQDGYEDGYWFGWGIGISTCDVTYDSNGGSAVPTETVAYNATASEPADPTKANLTFAGWYVDEELITPFNFSTDTITGDKTLYAKWTATVTYEGNENTGGSAPVDGTAYPEGNTVIVSNQNTLYKTGYFFLGWDTQPDDSGMGYNPGDTFEILENMTLYAIWNKAIYNVTYEAGANGSFAGTSFSSIAEMVYYLEHPDEVPTVVADNGYKFLYWEVVTAPKGESTPKITQYVTTEQIEAMEITEDMTFKAIYEKLDSFTVTFDSNGGSAVSSQTVYDGNKATEPTEPTKEGYIFNGWWYDGTEAAGLWDFDENTVTENMTLYADWIVDNSGADEVQKGNITLTLTDKNGNPLAYYPVELHSTVINATTDANGQVTFSDVTLENHELVVFDKEGNELGTINLNMSASDTNTTSINGNDVTINFNESAVSIDIEISVEDDGSLSVKDVEINANPKTGVTKTVLVIGVGSEQVNIMPYLCIILTALLIGGVSLVKRKHVKRQ
jgi:uncharacterized repeat protein (TIGR02543 family)